MVFWPSCCSPGSSPSETGPSADSADLERLRTLPYLTYSAEADTSGRSGANVHDAERASPGYNLYCSRSRPIAFLLDMAGEHGPKDPCYEGKAG